MQLGCWAAIGPSRRRAGRVGTPPMTCFPISPFPAGPGPARGLPRPRRVLVERHFTANPASSTMGTRASSVNRSRLQRKRDSPGMPGARGGRRVTHPQPGLLHHPRAAARSGGCLTHTTEPSDRSTQASHSRGERARMPACYVTTIPARVSSLASTTPNEAINFSRGRGGGGRTARPDAAFRPSSATTGTTRQHPREGSRAPRCYAVHVQQPGPRRLAGSLGRPGPTEKTRRTAGPTAMARSHDGPRGQSGARRPRGWWAGHRTGAPASGPRPRRPAPPIPAESGTAAADGRAPRTDGWPGRPRPRVSRTAASRATGQEQRPYRQVQVGTSCAR